MRREFGMFVALLLLCMALWFSNHDFLGLSNVVNTSRQIAILGILAIGIGFVIVTGGIDLSIGSVIGLTGVLVAHYSAQKEDGGLGMSIWAGIAIAMAAALSIGLAQGLLITRLKLQPFIVTLGFMLMVRGISQTIAQGGSLSLGDIPFAHLTERGFFEVDEVARVPYPVLILLAVILVAGYVLHFTVFGRYVYAIGGNRDAAEYSGINVKRVETTTYVISAGLASVAGLCLSAFTGQNNHNLGQTYELYAITAAVLGGCSLRGGEGTIFGIVIGTCVMRVIENGFDMFQLKFHGPGGQTEIYKLDPNKKNIVIGMTILLAVVIDQIIHMVQAKRRTRRAGEIVAARQRALEAAGTPGKNA